MVKGSCGVILLLLSLSEWTFDDVALATPVMVAEPNSVV